MPEKSLIYKSRFYFHCDANLRIGDVVVFANNAETIKTTAEIIDNTKKFYHAQIITNEPVDNYRVLTKLM